MNREVELEYYVINSRDGVCQMCNIFSNIKLYEQTIQEVKKYCRDPKKYTKKIYDYESESYITLYGHEAFVEKLQSLVSWQERGRIQYEIGALPWFNCDSDMGIQKFKKIDCYEQFLPNKEIVADYVIDQYKNYLKEQRKLRKEKHQD